jgi:hypothetical protein
MHIIIVIARSGNLMQLKPAAGQRRRNLKDLDCFIAANIKAAGCIQLIAPRNDGVANNLQSSSSQ